MKQIILSLWVITFLCGPAWSQSVCSKTVSSILGTWRTAEPAEARKTVFYEIVGDPANPCVVLIRHTNGRAAGAVWRVDLSGQSPVTVPREVMEINQPSFENAGSRNGAGILANMQFQTRLFPAEQGQVQDEVRASTEFEVKPESRVEYGLRCYVAGTFHIIPGANQEPRAIRFRTQVLKLTDVNGLPSDMAKPVFLAGANYILRLFRPIFSEDFGHQLSIVRASR